MLWFIIWTLLVLATLAGAAWLGLRLWRSAKALMSELGHTSEMIESLSRRTAELTAARGPERTFTPHLLAIDAERDGWRSVRAGNHENRDERKRVRHRTTLARWRAIGIPFELPPRR